MICAAANFAQSSPKVTTLSRADKSYIPLETIRLTSAYAEIVLRRAELESELEALLIGYTEDFPKVKETRFEMEALKKEFSRLSAVKPTEISKLTSAMGKLVVRKSALETDLWSLRQKYDDNHTDVKRAKRRVEIYETAIKSILE
jgi:predicted  nucleic acid-binding Zn-ribbon protein